VGWNSIADLNAHERPNASRKILRPYFFRQLKFPNAFHDRMARPFRCWPHRKVLQRIIRVGKCEQDLMDYTIGRLDWLHSVERGTDAATRDELSVKGIREHRIVNRKQPTTVFDKLQNAILWD
jgi:hypothetical protein